MRYWVVLILTSFVLLNGCASHVSTSPAPSSSIKVANNPKASTYNVQLGVGYLKQGNYDLAKEKLTLALQQDPKSSTANSAMGYFLEKTGDYSRAEDYYKQAISLSNTSDAGSAVNNYGTFLCRRGQYQAAQEQFLKAAIDPNYLTPGKAYENAGLCALLIPDTKQAINYFQEALQKNPNLPNSMLQLAQLYYSNGDYKNSYKYLERYLQKNSPTAASLWLGIRLANQRNDVNSAATFAVLLKSQFSTSKEYQEYLKSKETTN